MSTYQGIFKVSISVSFSHAFKLVMSNRSMLCYTIVIIMLATCSSVYETTQRIPVHEGHRPAPRKGQPGVNNNNVFCIKAIQVRVSNRNIGPTKENTRRSADSQKIYIQCVNEKYNEKLNIAIQNVRSVKNKTNFLRDYIIDKKLNIFGITESWLQDNDGHIIGDLLPDGYSFHNRPRCDGKGGGVLLVFKSNLKIKFESRKFKTFENILCEIHLDRIYNFSLIYRPPPNDKNGFTNEQFLTEFSQLISDLITRPSDVILAGDFNIHLDKPSTPLARDFLQMLQSFGVRHLISEPTHDAGHCLDTVIVRNDTTIVSNTEVIDTGISDHRALIFSIRSPAPKLSQKTITMRDHNKCDITALKRDINSIQIEETSVSTAVDSYNVQLLMHKHVPTKTKSIIIRPNTKWYNSNIRKAKVIKRRLERRFRKSGLTSDKLAYRKQCDYINYLIKDAKIKFFSNKICETKNDKKKLFDIAKEILHYKSDPVYPDDIPPDSLPHDFAKYFADKIVKINEQITTDSANLVSEEIQDFIQTNSEFTTFRPVTVSEIEHCLSSSSPASCELDPIHTALLKQCKKEIAPIITSIVNLSLKGEEVSTSLKNAVVRPLLKNASLDPNNFKNFRPVSNLRFIGKIIEKIVAKQLQEYLDNNDLLESRQSAYKRYHSTETALLRVHNDLALALDKKEMAVLLLLDLSAAFDTISHDLLLKRLDARFGIRLHALNWIRSYLTNRTQYVTVNNFSSDQHKLRTGVPQGSVLGPILFTLYVSPLGDISRKHNINSHFYADDTQLYISFRPGHELSYNISKLERCVSDIKGWMRQNFLKLNEDKTEILLFGSSAILQKLSSVTVKISNTEIVSQNSVKNLGAIFDSHLSMEKFVSLKCQTASYYLRCISHIRPYLDIESTKTLVQALVMSRLDYANSLLLGANKTLIARLQAIQNSAARVIAKVDRRTSITPIRRGLHWLPVEIRIQFKILITCFNCIHGKAPTYLCEILKPYQPTRNLRSSQGYLLCVPFTKSKTFSSKCFSISAPAIWNNLPVMLRNCDNLLKFKSMLKTFLFKRAYNC